MEGNGENGLSSDIPLKIIIFDPFIIHCLWMIWFCYFLSLKFFVFPCYFSSSSDFFWGGGASPPASTNCEYGYFYSKYTKKVTLCQKFQTGVTKLCMLLFWYLFVQYQPLLISKEKDLKLSDSQLIVFKNVLQWVYVANSFVNWNQLY